MYEHFKRYLRKYKRNFNEHKFETDIMYRAVCFGQHGVPYHNICKEKKVANDYDSIAFEVNQYKKRNFTGDSYLKDKLRRTILE